jgi:hypothetical protein
MYWFLINFAKKCNVIEYRNNLLIKKNGNHCCDKWKPVIMYSFFFWLNECIIVFKATFSNISAISWRPVLVVKEAGVPGENHPVKSKCF